MQYIELKGIKKEDFYKKVEIDGANFRGKNLKSELSSDKIVKIFRSYPEMSLYWLVLGEGPMLRDEQPCSEASPADRDEIISLLREKIADKERIIADKERIIADKERIIADKERIIALLEEKIESMGGNSTAHSGAETA